MAVLIDRSEVLRLIGAYLGCKSDPVVQDSLVCFTVPVGPSEEVRTGTRADYIDSLVDSLRQHEHAETMLYSPISYENEIGSPGVMRRVAPLVKYPPAEDLENHLSYEVSPISHMYLLFLVKMANDCGQLDRWVRRNRHSFNHHLALTQGSGDLFELLRVSFGQRLSVKIMSGQPRARDFLSARSRTYLFDVSRSLGLAIAEVRSSDEMSGGDQESHHAAREHDGQFEAPKGTYNSALVHYYELAMSTANPSLQFLSFYQIAENFFEAVYNEDLVEAVKGKLADNGFSHGSKEDIRALIALIKSKIRNDREEEVLYLTLRKFVNLEKLKISLDDLDVKLIDYYRATPVTFCHAGIVDLRADDTDMVFRALANRIYATRNSVVHSKESEKPRYVPFRHDRELSREIPLLRCIAEEIVMSSSTKDLK